MIFDTLANAAKYKGLNPDIDKVLETALKYNKDNFPDAPLVLDEFKRMNNAQYTTHPVSEAVFEAHRAYIDVMIMIEGEETIYVKPTDRLRKITKEYDASIEALLAAPEEDATAVHMEPGCFCILFPQDAHMPGCVAGEAMPVKKFIGKVKIR